MDAGRILRLAAPWVAVLLVGFLLGQFLETPPPTVTLETGRADSDVDGGGTITTADWTYGLPSDVTWIDETGTFHAEGLPACTPPLSAVENLRFAWVAVNVEGSAWREVVWVDCRSVEQ